MKVLFFCPMWGMAHLPTTEMLLKIKAAGYDGIEFGFHCGLEKERETFVHMTKDLGLLTIAQQCFAAGDTFETYGASFTENLRWLASFKPVLINSHTGKDYYSSAQNGWLIEQAEGISRETNIPILHETHRGRFPFWPKQTLLYLKRYPETRLTADFSHYCAVSESLLEDQEETINQIISSCYHIHARVGHPQGPQVIDPRLPEWRQALDAHLAWWDRIVSCRQLDTEQLTITCEFGPEPYMLTSPVSGAPLASQWQLNLFMMELLRKRYHLN